MAGAVGNHQEPPQPEHLTRGEFDNHLEFVIKPIMRTLEKMDENNGELVDLVNRQYRQNHDALEELRRNLAPVLEERQEKKEAKRDNKLAIIGFISAVASMVMSGVVLLFFGSNN